MSYTSTVMNAPNGANTLYVPYDEFAERQVITQIIYDGTLFDESCLTRDDFYVDVYREIFERIKRLWDSDTVIDMVTVNRACEGCELVGGIEGLKRIVMNAGEFVRSDFAPAVRVLKEKAIRRKYIFLADKIKSLAYDADKTLDSIRDDYEQLVTVPDESGGLTPISDTLMSVFEGIVAAKGKGRIPGQRTGFSDIDLFTGGLEKGTLTVIGARPAMGKSVFGSNIAEYVAVKENKAAIYFNLEMRSSEVVQRILSSNASVPYSSLRFGTLNADGHQSLSNSMNILAQAPLYICDKAGITLGEIKSLCRSIKRKCGEIGVVVVDYLQLMGNNAHANKTRNDIIGELSRGLKRLAKELDCPIVAISQLSRAVEARSDKRPMMADLRESGSIEQDADTIMLLYRDEYYHEQSKDKGIAEVIVAKARQGQTGTVKMGFYPRLMRFMCLA